MKSRREFLKISAVGAAGAAGMALTGPVQPIMAEPAALAVGPGNQWPGRVVINFNKAAVTMSGSTPTAVPSVIATMVNDAILRLTGKTTLADAWRAIFPSTLTTPPKVAIKVPLGFAYAGSGATSPATAPHWASVKAVTDGLQLMMFGTTKFPAANITIYDTQGGGSFSNFGYDTNIPGITMQKNPATVTSPAGARNAAYAKPLGDADYLINVFSPRGHDSSYAGGVTLGFKNHYGTYSPAYHDSTNTPPYLRDINCTGPVINKNVLSVCSGIFGAGQNTGNPTAPSISYTTYAKLMDSSITNTSQPPTTIIMSTDPVTAEMEAIKMMRMNEGGKYTAADMPSYLKASAGVAGALSGTTYTIGIIDESAMDIRRILNGTTPIALNSRPDSAPIRSRIVATHVAGSGTTFIEYAVPENRVGTNAIVKIFDAKGSLIRSFTQRAAGVVNHLSWDETDTYGERAVGGLYVVRLQSGADQASSSLSLVR